MIEKSVPTELHEEFQAALEELEIAKQAMLKPPLRWFMTPEHLAAIGDLGAALEKAAANCSRIAGKIAAL